MTAILFLGFVTQKVWHMNSFVGCGTKCGTKCGIKCGTIFEHFEKFEIFMIFFYDVINSCHALMMMRGDWMTFLKATYLGLCSCKILNQSEYLIFFYFFYDVIYHHFEFFIPAVMVPQKVMSSKQSGY